MTVLESVIKVALTVALCDGHLDMEEATLHTQMVRYFMVFLQVFMFTIMFCHSVEHPDYTCPRNLLMISMILSSIILTAGVVPMVLVVYLKF